MCTPTDPITSGQGCCQVATRMSSPSWYPAVAEWPAISVDTFHIFFYPFHTFIHACIMYVVVVSADDMQPSEIN